MKTGIIGYGNIAQKHKQAIDNTKGIELEAIYDISPIVENGVAVYDNIDLFLEHDFDLAVICSPNGLHKKHTLKALAKGRDVLCEKPFALTSKDCVEMITAADKHRRKLFCTMQNRYSPTSKLLKELIDSDQLGDIYLIDVALYWNRNKSYYAKSDWRGSKDIDGGTLFTQFSHYVDTLYWLLGDMSIKSANFQNFDHEDMIAFEDTGVFNFVLDRGGMGTFSYTTSCFQKNFESSLTIIGSKGTIKVGGQYMDRVEYCNIDGYTLPILDDNDNIANISKIYQNILAHNVTGAKLITPPEDGLAVVDIIERVYRYK